MKIVGRRRFKNALCKMKNKLSILEFKNDYRFLSNFYGPLRLVYKDKVYPTSEHLYQALKTTNKKQQEQVRLCKTPGEAKRMGRKIDIRPDWEEIKVDIMYKILKLKLKNKVLQKKLLDTGTRFICEGNTWKDTFWGYDFNLKEGRNELGKLLMKVRDKLRKKYNLDPKPQFKGPSFIY